MDNANLWTRRSKYAGPLYHTPAYSLRRLTSTSTSKLSLSMGGDSKDGNKADSPRNFGSSRRLGDPSSHAKSNPFNTISPLTTNSPSAGASSAFGLGSGAFASFGSAKTPKTPGAAGGFDQNGRDKGERETGPEAAGESLRAKYNTTTSATANSIDSDHPLKSTWTLFYRPPTNKYSDYEKSTIKLASISSVESFWTIYSHLKRPSQLPSVSDYHIFKEGIRPVWEDEANKRGGKWIIRLKKGVADRYWEDILFAIVGDQFMEASDEVCGAVLSVRSGEDVLNVWTRNDGGRNVKIRFVDVALPRYILELMCCRETIKRLLAFPADTNTVWKSHDDSIAQRSALDEARQQKGGSAQVHQGQEKRRQTLHEEDKGKGRGVV